MTNRRKTINVSRSGDFKTGPVAGRVDGLRLAMGKFDDASHREEEGKNSCGI